MATTYTLPICRKDQVQPTKITTLLHPEGFLVYQIAAGSYIIRAETKWVRPIGTAARDTFLVAVNRPEVRGDPIEMTRDPSKFEDHGFGMAYFSYETLAEGKENEDKKSTVQAIREGYGHLVTFQVTEDLHVLAMDKLASRKWLVKQMEARNRGDLVELMVRHFSVKEGVGRDDSEDEDATISQFICSELSKPYELDGYGIHDGYPGFRPELALCMTLDPETEDMVGFGGEIAKSTQYGRVKAKAVCIASIFYDSSKQKAETRREREAKIQAANKAARSRPSPKRGRALDFGSDSPPKVRRGPLNLGSPDSSPGRPNPVPFPSLTPHNFSSPNSTGGETNRFDFSSPPRQPVFGSPSSPPTGK